MTINETLDATYKVRYFPDNPLKGPQNNKLPKLDYTQVIKVASDWMKDHSNIEIRDDSLPIFNITWRGVIFTENFKPDHPHFQEHIKIKIALDRAWGEHMSKIIQ